MTSASPARAKLGKPACYWTCGIPVSQVALRAGRAVDKVFERQPTVASTALVAALHGIYHQCLYKGRTLSILVPEVSASNSRRGCRCKTDGSRATGNHRCGRGLHFAGEGFFELCQDNFISSE